MSFPGLQPWRWSLVTSLLTIALASAPASASGFGGAPLPGGGKKMFDGAFGFGPEIGFLGRGTRDNSDIALSADLAFMAAHGRALLARTHAEIHVGLVSPMSGESGTQFRVSIGSGFGLPVSFGAAYATEGDGDGAHSIGPELRLRHFFGDGADAASIGLLARTEIFANRRDEYSDRLVFGIHGAFDLISLFD